jgi:hypothetical protein
LSAQTDAPPIEGTDPETGKLFDLPRVKVELDPADPTVIKLAFSGSIELERGKPDDMAFFNGLVAGRNVSLQVEAFVKSGPANVHRRDSDGNVDAVVASKSLIVHSVENV